MRERSLHGTEDCVHYMSHQSSFSTFGHNNGAIMSCASCPTNLMYACDHSQLYN